MTTESQGPNEEDSSRSKLSKESIKDIAIKNHDRIDPKDTEKYSLYSFSAYDDNNETPLLEDGDEINSAKYRVPNQSVLISKLNPRINRVWRVKEAKENAICSTEFVVLQPREEIPLDYLYAVLNEPSFRSHLSKLTTGTSGSHQRVKQTDILEYEITKFDKSEREFISRLYKTIEEKIRVNHRISKNLSKIAQSIFKSWFVDFELHDEFKQSDIGKIPEEFETMKLNEVIWSGRGYSYTSEFLDKENEIEGSYPMINLRNIGEGGGFRSDGYKYYTEDKIKDRYKVDSGDLIVAITDLTQEGRVIGSPALIPKLTEDTNIISQDVAKIVPEKSSRLYLYHLFKSKRFQDYANSVASGTTVLHLSLQAIGEFKAPIPTKERISEFDEQARPIHNKKAEIIEENRSLRSLQDTLLPNLMSGDIRVNDLNLEQIEVESEG